MMEKLSKQWSTQAFWVLVAMLWSINVFAQSQQNSTSQSKVKTSTQGQKKQDEESLNNSNPTLASLKGGGSGWRLQTYVTHTPRLRNDQKDFTDILLRADYNINNKHSLRFQQYFTKYYSKYSSDYEFQPFDTSVAHFYRMDWKPLGIGLQWRNHVTLPISNASQRDNLYTNYQTSIIASKAFFGGKFIAFAIPYFRYFFYEYKTSVSGRLLPWHQEGLSLGGLYFFTDKLSFYGGTDYRVSSVYNSQYDPTPGQIPSGTYYFDMSLSYQVNSHFSGSLNYSQGSTSYIQNGRYELVLFDSHVSRVAAGINYVY